jgi:hypothetical protein
MPLDVTVRDDCNLKTEFLASVIEEDTIRISPVNVTRNVTGFFINVFQYSTGQTPAYWVCANFQEMRIFIGGASTLQNGLDLLGGALAPGVPIGRARVNAAVAFQATIIANYIGKILAVLPPSILVCGHSYGGAIAEAFVAGLVQSTYPGSLQLYTQGAPRAGDSSLSSVLDPVPKLRVMDQGDPIPFFPPHFSEAPFATIALGFVEALNLAHWAQCGGGAILDPQGNLTPGELPPLFSPIAEVSLATWAAGVNGFASNEHSSYTYRARMLKQSSGGPSPPVDPTKGGFKGELALPLTAVELNAGPVLGPVLQKGGAVVAFSTVFIPVSMRWKAVRVGQIWYATWQGLQVVTCQSHSQAKSICKAFNKALKVLQNASAVSKGQMVGTWGTYLVAAGSSTGGFVPVLSVGP